VKQAISAAFFLPPFTSLQCQQPSDPESLHAALTQLSLQCSGLAFSRCEGLSTPEKNLVVAVFTA
jgi:hypothetical protein